MFFILDATERKTPPMVFLNPEIVSASGPLIADYEGCLSVPGVKVKVKRKEKVVIKATRQNGEEFEIGFDGILARCIQHEVQHLDGITILQHASLTARYANRKQLEYLESLYAKERARKIAKAFNEGKAFVKVVGIGPDADKPNMGGDMFGSD
jgi:peptide deformylase